MQESALVNQVLEGHDNSPENQAAVNFLLNKFFKDGDVINPSVLVKNGLISSSKYGVKVLGAGEFKKKFTVQAQSFSASAKEAIVKAGGTIEVLEKPGENNQLQNLKEPIKSQRQK